MKRKSCIIEDLSTQVSQEPTIPINTPKGVKRWATLIEVFSNVTRYWCFNPRVCKWVHKEDKDALEGIGSSSDGLHWNRPDDWLPMPEILPTDNKAAGIFAVFENDFNALAINLNGGSHTIKWGDGSTDATGSGNQTYNHVYDYSTLSGDVLVYKDGRNYKVVLVELQYTDATQLVNIAQQTTPVSGDLRRSQNWLDFISSSTRSNGCVYQSFNSYRLYNLERFIGLGFAYLGRLSGDLLSLKVLNHTWQNADYFATLLQNTNDLRSDKDGTPIDFISSNSPTNAISFLRETQTKIIGDIKLTSASFQTFMLSAKTEIIGDIEVENATQLDQFFNGCVNLVKVGKIKVSLSLTDVFFMFNNCHQIREIIFDGDMGNVSNVANFINECYSLERIITPNLTRGINLRRSKLSGQNLQDFFASLGTANGAQTLTLPAFTIGEPTTIATNKGYTIQYA